VTHTHIACPVVDGHHCPAPAPSSPDGASAARPRPARMSSDAYARVMATLTASDAPYDRGMARLLTALRAPVTSGA
jgi:hypothetical protein